MKAERILPELTFVLLKDVLFILLIPIKVTLALPARYACTPRCTKPLPIVCATLHSH
jgi:hypothetical protein